MGLFVELPSHSPECTKKVLELRECTISLLQNEGIKSYEANRLWTQLRALENDVLELAAGSEHEAKITEFAAACVEEGSYVSDNTILDSMSMQGGAEHSCRAKVVAGPSSPSTGKEGAQVSEQVPED